MSNINDGGPAFPCQRSLSSGMTLRDYFAAKALDAVCALVIAGRHMQEPGGPSGAEFFATSAYKLADAMLKARSA